MQVKDSVKQIIRQLVDIHPDKRDSVRRTLNTFLKEKFPEEYKLKDAEIRIIREHDLTINSLKTDFLALNLNFEDAEKLICKQLNKTYNYELASPTTHAIRKRIERDPKFVNRAVIWYKSLPLPGLLSSASNKIKNDKTPIDYSTCKIANMPYEPGVHYITLPIVIAIKEEKWEIAKCLLSKGASHNFAENLKIDNSITDKYSGMRWYAELAKEMDSLLDTACEKDKFDLVAELINKGFINYSLESLCERISDRRDEHFITKLLAYSDIEKVRQVFAKGLTNPNLKEFMGKYREQILLWQINKIAARREESIMFFACDFAETKISLTGSAAQRTGSATQRNSFLASLSSIVSP